MKHYPPKEAAVEIGVSVDTLARWRRTKVLLPASRTPGGQSRYSQEQIDEMRKDKVIPAQPVQLRKNKLEDLMS